MSERPLNELVGELLEQAKSHKLSISTEANIGEACARLLALLAENDRLKAEIKIYDAQNDGLDRDVQELRQKNELLQKRVDELERQEYICRKCSLRTDCQPVDPGF